MRSLLGKWAGRECDEPGEHHCRYPSRRFRHPVANDRPKVLAEVKGRPFLSYLLDQLESMGIRDAVIQHLATRNIEGRPVVYSMHALPPYTAPANGQLFPVADRVSRQGINLPTYAGLNCDDVRYVCDSLLECLVERKGV